VRRALAAAHEFKRAGSWADVQPPAWVWLGSAAQAPAAPKGTSLQRAMLPGRPSFRRCRSCRPGANTTQPSYPRPAAHQSAARDDRPLLLLLLLLLLQLQAGSWQDKAHMARVKKRTEALIRSGNIQRWKREGAARLIQVGPSTRPCMS
jgi:hypothetical protein